MLWHLSPRLFQSLDMLLGVGLEFLAPRLEFTCPLESYPKP